jgi:hypothetical protein
MKPKVGNKIYNLGNVVEQLKGKGDDDFMRMLVKLINSKSFTNIPDWMKEITMDNVEPSSFEPSECYARLVRMKFMTYERHHPATVLEDLTITQPVVFSVRNITYDTPAKKTVTLINCKGLAMVEKKSLAFCAATTATILSYYVRGKEMDLSERIKDEPSNVILGFRYASGLTRMRSLIEAYGSSSSTVRDDIYQKLTLPANNGVNYHYAALLATKFPEYYQFHDKLDTELNVFYEQEQIDDKDRLKGSLLEGKAIKAASGKSIEVMWRFLDQSRSVRGQDSAGCGTLSVGYYLGWEISRSFIKSISMALDIMNVLDRAKVKTIIMFSQYLPVNVVAILVNNGYYVVVQASVYKVCLENSKPGLYSSTSKKGIWYYDYKFTEPIIKKAGIEYCDIPKVLGQATEYFTYAYISPGLMSREDLGFYPTCMPHQGRVIVSNVISSVGLQNFIPRCIQANYFRNSFPLHRKGFWRFDALGSYMYDNRAIVIPSMTSIKMAKGLLTEIVIEEVPEVAPEDNEKLIIDKVDVKEVDKGYRIAAWASQVTNGMLRSDFEFLDKKKGHPSDILVGLMEFATPLDLLIAVGIHKEKPIPIETGEAQVVITHYGNEKEGALDGEDEKEIVNKRAIMDVDLPLDNFDT